MESWLRAAPGRGIHWLPRGPRLVNEGPLRKAHHGGKPVPWVMVNPASLSASDFPLPPSVVPNARRLVAEYRDVVERSCEFSKMVGDVVRGDPGAIGPTLHAFAETTSIVFRRWNLEILYLLSVENQLRYSEIRSFVKGISGRSLSLKLDEMEQLGLVARHVSTGKPPHVSYSLTDQGRLLTRLSLPMVLALQMERGLAESLGAAGRLPSIVVPQEAATAQGR